MSNFTAGLQGQGPFVEMQIRMQIGCRTLEDLQPSEALSGGQSRYSTVPKMPVSLPGEAAKSPLRRCAAAIAKLSRQLEQAEL